MFTTDSAACLKAIEIDANLLLKITNVDGVFSEDPAKNPNATLYKKISYDYALKKNLKIMDFTAFAIAKEHKLPIRIFNIKEPNSLYKAIIGKDIGTLIN